MLFNLFLFGSIVSYVVLGTVAVFVTYPIGG